MNINSLTFKIGYSAGMYAPGTTITDSLLQYGTVSAIIYDSQSYNDGFTQTDNHIDFSSLFTTSENTSLTILFEKSICIG